MPAIEITTGPLTSRGGATLMSLNETAPGARVIRCDYQRPRKGSVPTMGWQVGQDMGNSKPHLQFVMEYNWEDAKAAAKAVLEKTWEGGHTRSTNESHPQTKW